MKTIKKNNTKKMKQPRVNWERIKAFFEDATNKEVISISGIERTAGIKPRRLREALSGRENFPPKYEEQTVRVLEKFGMPKQD